MSIIEDAVLRVQTGGVKSQATRRTPRPHRVTRPRALPVLALCAGVALLAIGIWWPFSDQRSASVQSPADSTGTLAIPPIDAGHDVLPGAPSSRTAVEPLVASQEGEQAPGAAVREPPRAPEAPADPGAATAPERAPAPQGIADSEPSAPSVREADAPEEVAEIAGGMDRPPVVAELTAPGTAHRPNVGTPSGPAEGEAVTPEVASAALPSQWLSVGQRAFLAGDGLEAALVSWHAGLESLDSERLVLVVGVYRADGIVEQHLRHLSGQGLPVFAARGLHQGSESLYLLALPEPHELETVRAEVESQLGIQGLRGNWASVLVNRLQGED
jgi:hypothetical protein